MWLIKIFLISEKSIEVKINNALNEATNLLMAEREKLFNELKKLNSGWLNIFQKGHHKYLHELLILDEEI